MLARFVCKDKSVDFHNGKQGVKIAFLKIRLIFLNLVSKICYTILFKRKKMQILEFFYENAPQNKPTTSRKVRLDSQNTLIKGARHSGKKSLILDYLSGFERDKYLFLDFEDVRFSEKCLENLAKFVLNKQASAQDLKIIVFYGVSKDFSYDFAPLLKHAQIIVASEFSSLEIPNFKEIKLDFLDFEEFVSLSKKNAPINSQVGAFLQAGRSFCVDLNEHLRAHFCDLEREILRHIALNLGAEFSANELYGRLKRKQKISKDSLYKAISELENKGVVHFLPFANKRLKKAYFGDFALKNALCIDKNFKQLFANVIFTELLKLKDELVYDNSFEFYLLNAKTAFIPSPTLDIALIELKAKKLLSKALEIGIFHIVFITLSTQHRFFESGVKVEALPFDEWALGF